MRWKELPAPDGWDHFHCPAEIAQYGERGELELVRMRAGTVAEVHDLSPYFEDSVYVHGEERKIARVARYPRAPEDDLAGPTAAEALAIQERPQIEVLDFVDYDHDGRATEFLLTVSTGSPCGQHRAIVVGISRSRPVLHAFGTVEQPAVPLTFWHSSMGWARLAAAPEGKWIEASVLNCGNHGIDMENLTEARWDRRGIHARNRWFHCTSDYKRGGAAGGWKIGAR